MTIEEIKAIIKQYADKGERLYNESCETKEDSQTIGYWDGYRDCANLLLRELDDIQEYPKKCMYSKDDYTDEDRKVLCDGCEEKCEYAQKEADWLQELHNKLDSLSKEDFDKVWAKYHQEEETVSEDLEEAAEDFCEGEWDGLHDNEGNPLYTQDYLEYTFKAGAQWQKEQMMKDAVCTKICAVYPLKKYNEVHYAIHYPLGVLPHKDGEKVKVIIVKDQ